MYAVNLTDSNNVRRFYTGRAGRYFLSPNAADAFLYETQEGAMNRARILNQMMGGVEFRFSVLATA